MKSVETFIKHVPISLSKIMSEHKFVSQNKYQFNKTMIRWCYPLYLSKHNILHRQVFYRSLNTQDTFELNYTNTEFFC